MKLIVVLLVQLVALTLGAVSPINENGHQASATADVKTFAIDDTSIETDAASMEDTLDTDATFHRRYYYPRYYYPSYPTYYKGYHYTYPQYYRPQYNYNRYPQYYRPQYNHARPTYRPASVTTQQPQYYTATTPVPIYNQQYYSSASNYDTGGDGYGGGDAGGGYGGGDAGGCC